MSKQLSLLDTNELSTYDKEQFKKEKAKEFINEMGLEIIDEPVAKEVKKEISINDYIRFNNQFYKVRSILRHQIWAVRLGDTDTIAFSVYDVDNVSDNIQSLLRKGDVIIVKNEFSNVQEVIFLELLNNGDLYVFDELLGSTLVLKNYKIQLMKGELKDV
ncbi:hypothetical protein [Breznakia pachnodae]|uniref:Uncharacterized protein n=1 Tax=Breznakia pachnodae TaxID=265178 RepID=A0ABU0DZB8_9FIRM|nr:hypothetical protein [Breznakia pachnodae]MDQ0359980.1 hypothetical protein [Breznakia pachnodae]